MGTEYKEDAANCREDCAGCRLLSCAEVQAALLCRGAGCPPSGNPPVLLGESGRAPEARYPMLYLKGRRLLGGREEEEGGQVQPSTPKLTWLAAL